jgi:hypothetical protein
MRRVIVATAAIPAGFTAIMSVGARLPSPLLNMVAGSFVTAATLATFMILWHELKRLKQQLRWEEQRFRLNLIKAVKTNDMATLEHFLESVLDRDDVVIRLERREPSTSVVLPLGQESLGPRRRIKIPNVHR